MPDYITEMRTWHKIKCKTGPPELHGHSAGRVGNSMVVYGGEHQGVLQGDVWMFNFSKYGSGHPWRKGGVDYR